MRHSIARFVLAAALLAAFAATASAQAAPWQIDPNHSAAQFSVRHMMVSTVRGAFSKVTGVVNFDEKNPAASSVEVTVDTTTVDTRVAPRDADLRSERYLDVAKYPTMTFRSKGIAPAGEGRYKMTGDLTIHGVTREVTFDVEGPSPAIKDARGNLRRGASASTKINRKDFGVAYSAVLEGGGVVIGDELALTIDLEFVKPAQPAPSSGN